MEYFYITPCISVCQIDKEKRTCIGCGRTIDQITQWTKYTDEQRQQIMKELGYGKRSTKEDRMVRATSRRALKASRETGE